MVALVRLFVRVQALNSAHDLKRDVQAKSSELLSELLRHTDAEAVRYEKLSSATSKIEVGQKSILEGMTEQARGVQRLLGDAESIQRLINATSNDIEQTQLEIVRMQQSSAQVVDQTHADLLTLKQTQQAEFERAYSSLTQLQALQNEMAIAQQKGTAAVEALSNEQERAFAVAASQLSSLATAQAASFHRSEAALGELASVQQTIVAEQSNILGNVKTSGEELRKLSAQQAESFASAETTLSSIRAQAAEAEARLGAVLGELKHVAAQILSVNLDMVSELFRIESALFYVAYAPITYMLTATERTASARFWVFSFLLMTLLVELNLVSAAQRFHYTLSQVQFNLLRAQLRYALSCITLLLLALSALMHRDYAQLTYTTNEKNARLLRNNHRMLHELLARTEPVASPTAARATSPLAATSAPGASSSFRANPFQRVPAPLNGAAAADFSDSQPEGVARRWLTPRKGERLSFHSSTTLPRDVQQPLPLQARELWREVDVDACCPDHRTEPGLIQRMLTTIPATLHSFASTATAAATGAHTTGSTTAHTRLSSTDGGSASRRTNSAVAAAAAMNSKSRLPSVHRHSRNLSFSGRVSSPESAGRQRAIETEAEGEEEEEEEDEEDDEHHLHMHRRRRDAVEEEQDDDTEDEEGFVRSRSPRASSRSRSPSPTHGLPSRTALAACPSSAATAAAPLPLLSPPPSMSARVTRSQSRSRSASQATLDVCAPSSRQSTTPARKSAAPRMLKEELEGEQQEEIEPGNSNNKRISAGANNK